MPADGTFSPVEACNRLPARDLIAGVGPSSNTGQKSSLTAPIIDFATVVLDSEKARKFFRKMHPAEMFRSVFTAGAIAVGPITDRPFNFYERSCTLIDDTATICGKIGLSDDGKVQISLTGQGCQHVANWRAVADVVDMLDGKLSRVDIAVDDLTGEMFSVRMFKELHEAGEFTNNGRPPEGRFIDDCGSQKGCSMYVGQKGHKQLNVYEKGKQLGDPESQHTRCELRLYSKRYELTTDVLRNPGRYFGGAYRLLINYVIGEVERLELKDQLVNASAKAVVRFLNTQAGTGLGVLAEALGEDFISFLVTKIIRTGRPGRFKSFSGDLSAHLRTQLLPDLEN